MKNPLEHDKMFATPRDMVALMDYCERFTGQERVIAYACAGMALNLAHKMFEEALEEEKAND